MIAAMNEFLLDEDVQLAVDWGKGRNVFSVLGLGETRHSKMLAWLLDPREGHMQKDYFLKALLREAFRNKDGVSNSFFEEWEPSDLELYSFNHAISFTELAIGNNSKRKIDVAVIDPANEVAVFIENKTGSAEGLDQTTEYFEQLSEKYADFNQVFVFMDWNEGEAKDKGNWVNVDYSWLEEAIGNLLGRNILDSEMEMVLGLYLQHLLDDESETPLFKKPYSLLSNIAQKHKVFLEKLKQECSSFKASCLADFESNKHLWIYKRHEVFFDHLFEYSGFEYYIEQASKKLNVHLESDLKKNMFYVHMDEWEQYYPKNYEYWGISFSFKPRKDEGDEFQYELTIIVRIKYFENGEAAKAVAGRLQKEIGRHGSKNLVIAHKPRVCEENMVCEIIEGVQLAEKFISEYKKESAQILK